MNRYTEREQLIRSCIVTRWAGGGGRGSDKHASNAFRFSSTLVSIVDPFPIVFDQTSTTDSIVTENEYNFSLESISAEKYSQKAIKNAAVLERPDVAMSYTLLPQHALQRASHLHYYK